MKYWGLFLLTLLCSTSLYANEQVALVIGNNAYQGTAKLNNPINDAEAMAKTFKRMGFRVFLHKDTTANTLSNALDEFGEAAEKATIAVVFYAGHGIQVDGENYLIPTNIAPKKQRDLRKLLSLQDVMTEVAHASKLGVVLLDACRDNPFASNLSRSLGRSTGGRGLARIEQTAGNVLVSFATNKDNIALDGTGKHSPYTQALLANIEKGKDIRKVLGQVRDDVQASTQKSQIPYVYGSLGGGDYCLTLRCLNTNTNPVIAEQPVVKETKRYDFEPKMVKIRGGSFQMGSPASEKERRDNERQHEVYVNDFWIGQYEVTFAEWDACVAAGGCTHKPDDKGWGRGQRPVINVSWNDAQVYIAWLNKQTGKSYRLPTEAEWEYAARAGTTSAFSFGDAITSEQANFDGNYPYNSSKKGRYLKKTTKVGQYPANDFGLYDMHGNVWEWTCSAYRIDYQGEENRCATAEGSSRVLRGGGWGYDGRGARSAMRGNNSPDSRSDLIGLRLALGQPSSS